MISEGHIENFSKSLKSILEEELKMGNEFFETSKGWPEENSIMIILKKPFLNTYELDHVNYKDVNDPHYWKAEYFDILSKHVLACKF